MVKKNPLTKGAFQKAKAIRNNYLKKDRLKYTGTFINRSQGKEKLCIVLAGYKNFLYSAVFGRLEVFLPIDIDVCVVTSGKYCEETKNLCDKNSWSYLSTKENNVSLVQNVAINLHPNAKYIFKLDEDMFITENYFDRMYDAFLECEKSRYSVGVLAPLIPLNGFAHLLILDKLGLSDDYEKRFEKPMFMAGPTRQIETNPDVAKYFWGAGNIIPSIDFLNKKFSEEPFKITACPIRFSIGAILFSRNLWEDMGYLSVDRSTTAMGLDEKEIVQYCCASSRPLIVTENVLVGHFAFGPQTAEMKKYYIKYPEKFKI